MSKLLFRYHTIKDIDIVHCDHLLEMKTSYENKKVLRLLAFIILMTIPRENMKRYLSLSFEKVHGTFLVPYTSVQP